MTPPADEELRPTVEGDTIARALFWGAGTVTVLVLCASVFVARALLHSWSRGGGGAPSGGAVAVAPPQLGIVEQTAIRETRRGLDEQARQRESLGHYGWVDPEHRVARIPIERAMDLAADPAFLRRAFAPDRDGGP